MIIGELLRRGRNGNEIMDLALARAKNTSSFFYNKAEDESEEILQKIKQQQ